MNIPACEKILVMCSAIEESITFAAPNARVAQLVEHDLAKVGVAGSNPVSRSKNIKMNPPFAEDFLFTDIAALARMVKQVDTQDLKSCGHCGRAGSIPAPGTTFRALLSSEIAVGTT